MTESPEERKPKDPTTWIGPTNDRVASLSEYFVAGAERYTPEALQRAASESGFTPDEIDEAYRRVLDRQRDEEMARPVRRRSYWIVLAVYGLVYAAFAVVFLENENRESFGAVALAILTFMLGVALLISIRWVRGRRPAVEQMQRAMLTMLALPLVLLVSVAGLCVATTQPYFQ